MHQDMMFFVEKISESLPPIFTRSVAVSNPGTTRRQNAGKHRQ